MPMNAGSGNSHAGGSTNGTGSGHGAGSGGHGNGGNQNGNNGRSGGGYHGDVGHTSGTSVSSAQAAAMRSGDMSAASVTSHADFASAMHNVDLGSSRNTSWGRENSIAGGQSNRDVSRIGQAHTNSLLGTASFTDKVIDNFMSHPVSSLMGAASIGVAGPMALVSGAVRGLVSGISGLINGEGWGAAAADAVEGTVRGSTMGPAGLIGMAGDYVATHMGERKSTDQQNALNARGVAGQNAANAGQKNGPQSKGAPTAEGAAGTGASTGSIVASGIGDLVQANASKIGISQGAGSLIAGVADVLPTFGSIMAIGTAASSLIGKLNTSSATKETVDPNKPISSIAGVAKPAPAATGADGKPSPTAPNTSGAGTGAADNPYKESGADITGSDSAYDETGKLKGKESQGLSDTKDMMKPEAYDASKAYQPMDSIITAAPTPTDSLTHLKQQQQQMSGLQSSLGALDLENL